MKAAADIPEELPGFNAPDNIEYLGFDSTAIQLASPSQSLRDLLLATYRNCIRKGRHEIGTQQLFLLKWDTMQTLFRNLRMPPC
jgi:hypothetical protein